MAATVHRNHLVIGLGGTGGSIIRSLRKLIYQNFREDDPDGVNLRYLYVDTSPELMDAGDPTWKILGRSVQLPERSQMLIAGMNLRDILDNIGNYPGISPWLGSREAFSPIIGSAGGASTFAAQKRRLGRFLFAGKAADFRRRVEDLVHDMQTHQSGTLPRSNPTTFHVCCGLAGGTGSGSIVDAVCQIRSLFKGTDYRILIYALLPERHPPSGKAKAGMNYQANGYAALLEVNALAIGSWRPHDVTGGQRERFALQDPFDCCYLFNDENEANVSVDVAKELPDIVSSFLFQKIVEIQHIEWGETNTLLRQETYEVGGQAITPETSPKGRPRRARRFFSFGIKQIVYPEVEIREYLTYSFARQSVLQLLFNKWVDGQGYREEAVNQPFAEFVREKSTLERWYLDMDRLTLSSGILQTEINNKKWRPVTEYWALFIPSYVTRVSDSYKDDVPKMLPELAKACDEAYKETYRGEGVAKFYETKRNGDLRAQSREIRGRIEEDLFAQWRDGARSMNDISQVLTSLLAMLEQQIDGIDDKVQKLGEESDVFKTNEISIAKNRESWAKMGIMSIAVGKHKKILSAQAECFVRRYTVLTKVAGLRYAKDLLIALRQEINGLSSEVAKCTALISKSSKTFETAIQARCSDKGTEDLTKQIVRFYEPPAVIAFAKGLNQELSVQRKQTSKVRSELSAVLGDKQTFAAFSNRISEGRFVDILESTCEQSALEAHEEFVTRNPDHSGVLGVGLIELMRKEYEGNNEKLRGYIKKIMDMSKNYLKLSQSEHNKTRLPGVPNANDKRNGICITNLTVIAPAARDSASFRNTVFTTFKNATDAETQEVINARRPHEITLIHITSGFPARFADVLGHLKNEYDLRVHGGRPDGPVDSRAYLELHSEGEGGTPGGGQEFPDLYMESYKPSDLRPWMMLADGMNLLRVAPDSESGVEKVYLVGMNDGFETLEKLGSSMDRVIEEADVTAFETVRTGVEARLAKEYRHKIKRDELILSLRTKMSESFIGMTSNSPAYLESLRSFDKAKEILGTEAIYAGS